MGKEVSGARYEIDNMYDVPVGLLEYSYLIGRYTMIQSRGSLGYTVSL